MDSIRMLFKLGFKRIVIFPYFLFSGVLVSRIRNQTKKVAEDHPEIEFISSMYSASPVHCLNELSCIIDFPKMFDEFNSFINSLPLYS